MSKDELKNPPAIRQAVERDVPAVTALVNDAYEVERFFVSGDRVSQEEVRAALAEGVVYVSDAENKGKASLAACVHVTVDGNRGAFGLLAVEPAAQGRGLGRHMIRVAEQHVVNAGATIMEICVVNLRSDLLRFYGRLGYRATGTAPYVDRPIIQPVHFVVMEKDLRHAAR